MGTEISIKGAGVNRLLNTTLRGGRAPQHYQINTEVDMQTTRKARIIIYSILAWMNIVGLAIVYFTAGSFSNAQWFPAMALAILVVTPWLMFIKEKVVPKYLGMSPMIVALVTLNISATIFISFPKLYYFSLAYLTALTIAWLYVLGSCIYDEITYKV